MNNTESTIAKDILKLCEIKVSAAVHHFARSHPCLFKDVLLRKTFPYAVLDHGSGV